MKVLLLSTTSPINADETQLVDLMMREKSWMQEHSESFFSFYVIQPIADCAVVFVLLCYVFDFI